MSEEETIAIERLKKVIISETKKGNMGVLVKIKDLETVLHMLEDREQEIKLGDKVIAGINDRNINLIEICKEKDKIIDMMADWLVGEIHDKDIFETAEDVKEYFERKVENES